MTRRSNPSWARSSATTPGRPTPLHHAKRLTERAGGAEIYLKREDLAHTGAHKINNALGQGLLAKRMGKSRVVAETGAGQHGVAAATVCALLDVQCVVYMGEEDMRRQAPNVYRMRMLGAEVRPVAAGARTLKEAISETIRDWVTNVRDTHYVIGSAVGPHPYPMMVRDLQSVIGRESREQMLERTGRLPDAVAACVGGGSNAIGQFHAFIPDEDVRLIGVEAAGDGVETGRHAASIGGGSVGVLHGSMSYVVQDADGQIEETHSVSAGLDYPGVGPEHAWLRDSGRAEYVSVTDDEAVAAFPPDVRTRGRHPRAGVVARRRLRGERARPGPRRRQDGARLHERPRRQRPRNHNGARNPRLRLSLESHPHKFLSARAPLPSFPRRRESRPIDARKRRIPPLPIRGEDAANAAGEGTADGARSVPSFPIPTVIPA